MLAVNLLFPTDYTGHQSLSVDLNEWSFWLFRPDDLLVMVRIFMAIADLLLNIVEMVPCGFCCLLSDEYPLCARGIDITYPQTQFAMVTSFGSQMQCLSKNKQTNEWSFRYFYFFVAEDLRDDRERRLFPRGAVDPVGKGSGWERDSRDRVISRPELVFRLTVVFCVLKKFFLLR